MDKGWASSNSFSVMAGLCVALYDRTGIPDARRWPTHNYPRH
jgi:hypothetical protein